MECVKLLKIVFLCFHFCACSGDWRNGTQHSLDWHFLDWHILDHPRKETYPTFSDHLGVPILNYQKKLFLYFLIFGKPKIDFTQKKFYWQLEAIM